MGALKLKWHWRLSALAAASLWSCGVIAADAAAVNQLVQQAQFWEQKQKPDLAIESWKRVLAVDPKNTEALSRLVVLEGEAGNAAQARQHEEKLLQIAPDALTKQAASAQSSRSRENTLARARDLARQNRAEEAVPLYRQSFANGAPENDALALEYFETLAGTRNGWKEARDGLQRLSKSHPEEPRYALAYSRTLTYRLETRREGIDQLKELSAKPEISGDAQRAWRQALIWMAPSPADRPRYESYLKQVGQDAEVEKRLAEASVQRPAAPRPPRVDEQTASEMRTAFAALEANEIDAAESGFSGILARKANDPDALAGLGVVRLRQGRFGVAEELITRAIQAKPSLASGYREARQTATFWTRVRAAEAAVQKDDYAQAEKLYESALTAPPGGNTEPSVISAAAKVLVHNSKPVSAERLLRSGLETTPGQPDLVAALAELLQNDGRASEAQQLITAAPSGSQPKLQGVRIELARQQAASAMADGRYPEAEAVLRQALVAAPESPWVRLDLARLYRKMGRESDADTLLDTMSSAAADGAEGALARSYAYAESQRWYETLQSLEDLPATQRTEAAQKLQREAWVRYQVQRSQQAAKLGDPERAAQWLSAAVSAAGDTPELSTVLAQGWAALGDPARAVSVLRKSFSSGIQPSAGDRIQYAALLLQLDQSAEFEAVSTELIRSGGMTPLQQRTLEDLVVGYRIKMADQARESGDLAESYRQLREVVSRYPGETRVQLALGRLFTSAGEPKKAMAIAKAQMEQGGGPKQVTDELLYASIDSALASGDEANASRWIDAAFKRGTDPVAAHRAAARLAESRGRQAEALNHYRAAEEQKQQTRTGPPLLVTIDAATGHGQALPAPVTALLDAEDAPVGPLLPRALGPEFSPKGAETDAERAAELGLPAALRRRDTDSESGDWIADYDPTAVTAAERLEAATSSWMLGGLQSRSRQGEAGLSRLLDVEFDGDWVGPEETLGRLALRARPVMLDAGSVSGTNLLKFGTMALIQGESGERKQSDSGVAVSVGYQLGSLVLDVGTTPLGFRVENVIGGLRWTPQVGSSTFNVDISRRAVTDSLLSYAGAYDPLTGYNWGGVTRSGARLDYAYDVGKYGVYLNGGYYAVTGRNVEDNSEYEVGAGIFSRLYRSASQTVTAGLNVTTFAYEKNLRHFTFGHGGYFSPQFFGAVTVPVSWVMRRGPLTLRADIAVGSQTFREDGAPLYPGSQALQDELERLAVFEPSANLPLGYGSQSNTGLSYKVGGGGQYRLTQRLIAGGNLSFDNARDYKEAILLAYLRFYFTGIQPLATEPRPPQFYGAPLP